MKYYLHHRKRLVLGLVGLAVLWLLVSVLFVYFTTRRPHSRSDEPIPKISGGPVEAFRLTTRDGQDLGAWFVAGQPAQPLCLLLHGNGKRRSDMLSRAEIAVETGAGVMLLTLRAHGDSTGDYNDIGYSAREDVLTAVAWLEARHPGRRIVVWGDSMGAAAATFAAGDLGNRVHGYILEGPYRDLRTAVWNRMNLYLLPVLDSIAYAGIMTVAPLFIPDLDSIAPLRAAASIPEAVPVLVLTGTADRKATPAEAQAFVECIGNRCRLVTIRDGDHGKLQQADPVAYREAITCFVSACNQP